MNTAFVQNTQNAPAPASRNNTADWEQAITVFHGNFYRLQLLLQQADQFKPKQVKEFQTIQQLMLTALTELHEDLDSPLSTARTLARHTDIINALNGRVAVVLAHA